MTAGAKFTIFTRMIILGSLLILAGIPVRGALADAGGNFPPDAPELVAPADQASNVSLPASLSVAVSDPDNQPLDVTFYGRTLQPRSGQDFTIVAVPDTQNYAARHPEIYNAQMQWVADHKTSDNIIYVAGLGDLVDDPSMDSEWMTADTAWDIVDAANIPYGNAVGNHDGSLSTTENFNLYFGITRFLGKPWYGGHYGSDNDNHYDLFEASGQKFLAVFIEYDSTMTSAAHPVLDWANNLLQANPDRRAMVVTHDIIGYSAFTPQGRAIYDALKGNANLFLMLGSHMDIAGQRTDVYNGHTVYTLRSDYQDVDSQVSGYLRIMRFSPTDDMIHVRTYSPTQDKDYDAADAADNNFSLADASDGTAFEVIGTASAVPSGGIATVSWSGLTGSSQYGWFAVASDGTYSTGSHVWKFTSGLPAQPPVAQDDAYEVDEDVTLSVAAPGVLANDMDANQDPLTAILETSPEHGELTLESNGAFTYSPRANFSGADSFRYKANDGRADSDIATVSITVNAVNDPPHITSWSPVDSRLNLLSGECQDFEISASDPEADPLEYGWQLDHQAVGNGQNYTYCPLAPDSGTHTLAVSISDGSLQATLTWEIKLTPRAPEIDVQGNGTSISSGDMTPSTADGTDFGSVGIWSGPLSRSFTVMNTGNSVLALSGDPKVVLSGAHVSDFTVTQQPSSPIPEQFGSATFTVAFDPSAVGLRTAVVSIANNDPTDTENPYTFAIQGTGFANPPVIISGNAGAAEVTLRYAGGSTVSDSTGRYALRAAYGWSGTVTPYKAGLTFTPASRTYTNVTTNWAAQHYSAIQNFPSIAAQDGYLIESGENTSLGGTVNYGDPTFKLGDDAARRQYRGILSFNTSSLPDNAVITGLQLKLTRQTIVPVATNPFALLWGLLLDVRPGFFGTTSSLQATDFQAAANQQGALPTAMTITGATYTITLPKGSYPYINKLSTNGGLTQLRLRFKLDDNNNAVANYISFFSGSAATAPYRPTLIITYRLP